MHYRFDSFILDTGARELRRKETIVELEPRTYELLVFLLEHRDEAVAKDTLQEQVWETIVTDSALTRSVMKLRRALDDRDESIIKTVPRFGYKFVAAVEALPAGSPEPAANPAGQRTTRAIAAAGAVLLLILAARFFVSAPLDSARDTSATDVKSVAVLPFDDLSEAQDQRWFADGLAEELLNALARTPDLLVAARTSSFSYRGSDLDVPAIAAKLGVAHVVEGSVRRDGEKLRVTAQLIRAADGFHLWSETYDDDFADLIDTQERIAVDIANAMQTAMDPDALRQMLSTGTRSVAAFEAYLEGLADYDSMIQTGDIGSYTMSIDAFERAVAADPGYAAALGAIAEYWSTQLSLLGLAASHDLQLSREEIRHRYRDAMDRAIANADDPVMELLLQAKDAYATQKLRRALELNTRYLSIRPNDWSAQSRQINLLSALNRYDELIATSARYIEQNAFSPVVTARALHTSLYSEDRDAIETILQRNVERYGESIITTYQVHRALLWLGRIDDARQALRRLEGSDLPDRNIRLARLRQACAEGDNQTAEALFRQMIDSEPEDLGIQWLSHKLMGRDADATATIAHFDEVDVTAYSGFLEYGSFDPRPHRNLMRFLAVHGDEHGPPVAVPFRCYRDNATSVASRSP